MKKIDWWIWLLVIVNLVFLLVALRFILTESSDCLRQPFVYGAQTTAKNFEDVLCKCESEKGNFFFNSTDIWHEEKVTGEVIYPKINFSIIQNDT